MGCSGQMQSRVPLAQRRPARGGFWGVLGGFWGVQGGVPQNGPFSGFSHFSGNSPENLCIVDEKIIVDINSWTNFFPAHKKNIFVMGKFSGQHSAEKIFLPGKLFRQICQNPARRNLTKCAHAKSDKSAKIVRRRFSKFCIWPQKKSDGFNFYYNKYFILVKNKFKLYYY